jgi:hypothetical protein
MLDARAEFDSLFADAKASDESARASTHFARDCLWIVNEVQNGKPESMVGVAALVMLSIQQPFYMMPRQIEGVARDGVTSPYLFGAKRNGLACVMRNRRELHRSALRYADGAIDLDTLILDYLAVPCLGIVKASFLAQMTVGDGACLDTLNLRTLGLAESAFRLPKTLTAATVRKRIAAYNAVWRSVGDSAHWWDSWCDLVASRSHNARGALIQGFDDTAHVSRTHRLAITGGIESESFLD